MGTAFLYFNVSLPYFLTPPPQTTTKKPNQKPASTAFIKTRMNAANTPIPTDECISHFEMKNFHFSKYTVR